jgi:thiamine biosynthesis lipoprotein
MEAVQDKFFALGSDVVLTLVADPKINVAPLLIKLKRTIIAFEERFSRFKATSELSNVNHSAGLTVAISLEFSKLLRTALDWARDSGGIYNPLILPSLQAAGYAGSWPHPADADLSTNFASRRNLAPAAIKLEPGHITLPSDSALDFGGIGKGYLLDELARLTTTQSREISGFWFSLGGDIVAGGLDQFAKPWHIGLARATNPNELAGEFVAANAASSIAVATSGVTKRRGTNSQGRSWHHLIDPRTCLPANTNLLSVSVQSTSATSADVLAKCAVILGSTAARPFLRTHNIDHALLQLADPQHSVIALNQADERL